MPKHRGRGEGSLRQRANGSWQASLTVTGGQRLYHTAASKREALAWLREKQAEAAKGALRPDASKITLGELLGEWLEAKEAAIEPKTYQGYEGAIRRHIRPKLGAVVLSDLTTEQIQQFYNTLKKHPQTAQHCHLVLHQCLGYAVRPRRLLEYNLTEGAIVPRYVRPEMQTWTPQQANLFLASVEDERWAAVYWVMLTCGLRAGEVCGLKWQDLDREGRRLQVRRNVQRVPHAGGLIVGQGKTDRARVLELIEDTIGRLEIWRERQELERQIAGERWQSLGYIFTTRHGTPLEPRRILRDFDQRVARLGLPDIRPHDLRHTCGTLLLSLGVPMKVVSEILGHSSIGVTLNIYGHVTETMQEQAAAATRKLYSTT